MNMRWILSAYLWVVIAGLVASGCERSQRGGLAGPSAETEQSDYRISGPFAHQNLSVFLIHSKNQDDRDFITLDQGLKEGSVSVTEKKQEQVSELQIENRSDKPLFLQEGDRLQGGKQDRTIMATLVIPPRSGKMPLPTFCIEQGRWQTGSSDKFVATFNPALATKEVRAAAKFDNDQGEVWTKVRIEKEKAMEALGAVAATTSLNEALDSPQVKKVSDDFTNALSGVLKDQESAVGVAIVVNGNIEEVDIYPNHKLLRKLYPRLLQSYALQATAQKEKAKDAKAVTAADVGELLKTDNKKHLKRTDQINAANQQFIYDADGARYCEGVTAYAGKPVHRQVMAKNASPSGHGEAAPTQTAPRNSGPRQGVNPPPRP
jgi:hypothetical protein